MVKTKAEIEEEYGDHVFDHDNDGQVVIYTGYFLWSDGLYREVQEPLGNLKELAESLLDDDNGISEVSYGHLRNILIRADMESLLQNVKATDGRFYLRGDK